MGVLPGKVANVGQRHITSSNLLLLIDNSKLTDLVAVRHATEEHRLVGDATDFDSDRCKGIPWLCDEACGREVGAKEVWFIVPLTTVL